MAKAKYIDKGKKPDLDQEDEDEMEIDLGVKDEDVETKGGREELLKEDEISPSEEGFMEGESEGEVDGMAECANCGKVLSDEPEEVIEAEINSEMQRFCSEKCAKQFQKRKQPKVKKK